MNQNMKKLNWILAALAAAFLASCVTTDPGSGTAARGVKPYPHDTCIVTDNKLGSMGDPVRLVHDGQEVKFCCSPCVDKFEANPQKYLSRL